MPYIASEDYPNKRIYLHVDTALLTELDVINIYKEHRQRRRLNANGERRFDRMVTAFGNDQFGTNDFTPRYVNLEFAVRLVPHDTDHRPLITPTPLISISESLSGRDLFDRSSLTPGVEVDVDYQPEKTGFRTVNIAGAEAITPADKAEIAELVRQAIFGEEGFGP